VAAPGRLGEFAIGRFVVAQFGNGGLGRTAATEKPGRLQRVDSASTRLLDADIRSDFCWCNRLRALNGSSGRQAAVSGKLASSGLSSDSCL
jgi:hypothetical protein